jgi:predicted metal-binding membrane protein
MIQLLIGYLGVWALFGLAAFAAAWAGGRLAQHDARAALYAASAILLVGGSYQLTPLKDACLKRCRSPIATLLHFAEYKGRLRDLRVGITHGGSCLGCCWGLMMVLVAVGVMDVAWMAGLAAVIFLEKVWRWGKPLGVAFGIALIVLAFFVPSHPWLVPGLHASNTPSMMMKG